MAAEIEREFAGASVKLTPSRGGRFEVLKDGVPVFEKSKLDRHAKPGEVIALLKEKS
ncbi:MAG: Rdx family protein [Gemmatimonadaceae bacterium]